MQTYSEVTLLNAPLPNIMSPSPELQPEMELEFSPLTLILLMDNSWPNDWHS